MENVSTAAIWTAFSDRLRAFIGRRVKDANDVEDVLQDAFARIHAGWGSVKEGDKLEAWLFQVARRAIIDHFRSRSGRRRNPGLPEDVSADIPDADISAEVASWLEPMLSLIPEEDREALRLTYLEGVPQKALASRLGLSATGARSRVQRARQKLKDVVLECCRIEMDRRGNAIGYTRRRAACDPQAGCDPGAALE